MALVLVLAVLAVANLLTNRLAPQLYLPICVTGAGVLLLAGRRGGLSWSELGLGAGSVRTGLRWAAAAAAAVLAGYLLALALPATRAAFADERAAGLSVGALAWFALVRVPLGTVLLEEVGFRGVLWGLLARRLGTGRATALSSAAFGAWHVLPSLGLTRGNAAAAAAFGTGATGRAVAVLAAVAGTAVAGAVFCELRRRSGSLLAPAGLHCATNSLGYLLAWATAP
jgi:membrane protease YdiL (CAAX protease family)